MLSKIAQIKTEIYELINVWNLKNVRLTETESRSMLVRAGGWGKGVVLVEGYRLRYEMKKSWGIYCPVW